MTVAAEPTYSTVVLHVGNQYRGSEKLVVEKAMASRHGVIEVDANPAAQTATVTYDSQLTSIEQLQRFVAECGFECAG
jgi:Cu2+-exporting ATPase